jgi:asparagine synthase (glutamine-hydrolysing)
VREALDEVRCEDEPGREMYFFRMAHDQRRHLALHFEDADLHRMEFLLPFYDADLLSAVASMPVDYGVGHRLYHAALRHFPATVTKVAWQTYPGHEPCPIPLPESAIDQWGDRQKDIIRRRRRRGILGEVARVATIRPFPHRLLNRPYLIAAAIGHWLGIDDYAYAVDYAKGFTDVWRVASGRWALPR